MNLTPAGERDKRVVFLIAKDADSDFNNDTPSGWSEIGGAGNGRRWGKVSYGTGQERRRAAAEEAGQAATVRVIADSLTRAITIERRMQFDGLTFNITSIAPVPGRREIDFTGTAARD